ncbi:hypothetical protein SAMN05443246_2994 [Paenibacillus sp. GP183]|nr:hypothetical protein SAMN05443246_2994 [Paenibacillus sp. GP183]
MRMLRIIFYFVLLFILIKITYDALYSLALLMGFDSLPNNRNRILARAHAELWAIKYTTLLVVGLIGCFFLANKK